MTTFFSEFFSLECLLNRNIKIITWVHKGFTSIYLGKFHTSAMFSICILKFHKVRISGFLINLKLVWI